MAAVPNYGLLSTMADGIREGLIGYQTMAQNQRANQQQDMYAQANGFIKDPNGNYAMSPEQSNFLQTKKKAEMGQYQNQLQQTDPTSDVSAQSRTSGKAYLNSIKDGLGDQMITDNMNHNQVQEALGHADKYQSGMGSKLIMVGGQLQKQDLANQGGIEKQQVANQGGGMGARSAVQVSKDYESSTKPYRQTQEDISRVESILNTKDKDGNPLITSQQLGDANAAMARIFSPGHMSDATVSRTEYESMPAKFAAAVQKWTTNPQDSDSRGLIEHIVDQGHHIANVSNVNAEKQIDSLDSGYLNQPGQIGQMAKSKSGFLHDRYNAHYPEAGESVPGAQQSQGGYQAPALQTPPAPPHPQDTQAVQWAKANPRDPRSAKILQQNGF